MREICRCVQYFCLLPMRRFGWSEVAFLVEVNAQVFA